MSALAVDRAQILRFRARASHLHERLPPGSFADASSGGLQDSVPRAAVISLHARVRDVEPASWDDPSLAQIWFRGGADYVIPRADIGVFTLGCLPRDADRRRALEAVADEAHEVLQGQMLKVREVTEALGLEQPFMLRAAAMTGRLLIRWNASMIWLIGNDRPDIDPEDARIELARRFLRWFGPQRKERLAWWTNVDPRDARATWEALLPELVAVECEGSDGFVLETDVEALLGAESFENVRLLPIDDPYLKTGRDLFVPDKAVRDKVFPPIGSSPGYIPGGVVIDGEIAGVWQRQQRRVTVHPWRTFSAREKSFVEAEALHFPIAAKPSASKGAEVIWS